MITNAMTRARKYLEKVPGALSGSGGHDQTFKTLASIRRTFGSEISKDEFITMAKEYNAQCDPPWSEKELQHKIDDVLKKVNPDPASKHEAQSQINTPAQMSVMPKSEAKSETTKLTYWKTQDEAQAGVSNCIAQRDHKESCQYNFAHYGLCPEDILPAWKFINQNDYYGSVYVGENVDNTITCVQYRSFKRGIDGKRESKYLYYGGVGVEFLERVGVTKLVIVSGAEKRAAAYKAGYNVLGIVGGENISIPIEWILYIVKILKPETIIVANDNDKAGADGNQETAAALCEAGFPPENIRIVQWANDDPKGYDLNDILKFSGVEGLRAFLESAKPYNPFGTITAAELQQLDIPEPCHIIQGLLPEGLTIVAGRPKAGKTRLLTSIALAISDGQNALNKFETVPKRCLYLALESSKSGIKKLITQLIGEERCWPHNFEIVEDWPRQHQGGLEKIEKWLKAHKDASLVVIDTYTRFRPPKNSRQDAYEQDAAATAELQKLGIHYHIAIILSTHQRKAKSEDIFETVTGTFGMTASADNIWVLERKKEIGKLHITGRDMPERIIGLSCNENGLWTFEQFIEEDESMNASIREEDEFLKNILADGAKPAKVIYANAKQKGISDYKIKQARARLGVLVIKKGIGEESHWYWELKK